MNQKKESEEKTQAYLTGYKHGFEASLKMAWALAEDLLKVVDNNSKDAVREYIQKIKN